ncbi:MAG: polyphenol oxidase family protein [Firmicutes bacterium]|nr:polyphenol oxidase family protein [Bacillota bacterium]
MGYIKWTQFSEIEAFTTTRQNGVSKQPFDSFNQAFYVGDNADDVKHNRAQIYKDFRIRPLHLVTTHQSHSTVIAKVTSKNLGAGETSFESGVTGDALYTYDKNIALGIFHADCVPVFLYAKKAGLIAIIHAGQIGTLKGVTEKSVHYLIDKEGISADDIHAFLGPSLSFSHNIIDAEMKASVIALGEDYIHGLKETNGETFLDIPLINFIQLRNAGVPSLNITLSEFCTYENKDLFFSTKRNPLTGRHLSIIKFK